MLKAWRVFSRKSAVLLGALVLVMAVLPAPVWAAIQSAPPVQEQAPAATAPKQKRPWLDVDGKPLPFQSDEEIKQFLAAAKVVKMEGIERGVNRPRKALLEKDGVRAHAAFRDVAIFNQKIELADGVRFNFRDDAIFECAAYELGRMLGMENIPPTVGRKIQGTKGTLQIWLENTMVEIERIKEKRMPPDPLRWNRHTQNMRVFDALIYNEDRNQGNILIDEDWNMWLIDHTRAFRTHSRLQNPEPIKMCERKLWEGLQALDEGEVKARLKEYLRPFEINGLLKRRVALIEHIKKLIAERGEGAVLFALD